MTETSPRPLDVEPAIWPPPGTDPRLRAWIAFLQAHAAVTRRLEAELSTERGLSLAEYDALLQLAIADEGRLRMSDLAERVVLSRSGMTRLVDRLEADGFVRRVACASDARVAWATLTEMGLARLRAAAPVHLRGVEQHFLGLIPEPDHDALVRGLEAILTRLRGRDAVATCASAARFQSEAAAGSATGPRETPATSGQPS